MICRIQLRDLKQIGVVFDAINDNDTTATLLQILLRKRRYKGAAGDLAVSQLSGLRQLIEADHAWQAATSVKGEQSNTSIVYGEQMIMKLFRRVEPGVNPDLEIGRFLTEKEQFLNTPALYGAIEYKANIGEPLTIAVANAFVPQAETAWHFALDNLSRYYEHLLAQPMESWPAIDDASRHPSMWNLAAISAPPAAHELAGGFWMAAGLLGQRTAELHKALASDDTLSAFAPEPFTYLYQRSLYQSCRRLTAQVIQMVRRRLNQLSPRRKNSVAAVLDQEKQLVEKFKLIGSRKIIAQRIRCHGDYHLGQVLYTGKDFQVIDFEGEPSRSLSQRRIKASPLQDVAGMIRSFHYAAAQGFNHLLARGLTTPDNTERIKSAGWYWALSSVGSFLKDYQAIAQQSPFFPTDQEDRELLLNFYLLTKAIYEVGYELNSRPDWVDIPLSAVIYLLGIKT